MDYIANLKANTVIYGQLVAKLRILAVFLFFFTFFLVSMDYALESRRSERFEQGVGSLQKFLVRSKVN